MLTLSDIRDPGWHPPLLTGAVVRILAWSAGLWSYGWVQTDTVQYWELSARGLAGYGARAGQLYEWALMRPPGYPAILAVMRLMHDSPAFVSLLQTGFGIAVIGLTYFVGKKLGGEAVGALAAWWVALSPILVIDSSVILTEVPYTAFLLLAVYFVAPLVEHGTLGNRRWAGAGLTLGLATLIRPISLYAPIAVLVALAASRSRLRNLASGLVFLVAFSVPVGLWMARNHAVTGVATISTIQGINLAYYRAAGAIAAEQGSTVEQARAQIISRVTAESEPGMNPAELSQVESRVGLEEIAEHPAGYLLAAAKGLALTLFGPARSHIQERFHSTPIEFLAGPLSILSAASASLLVLAAGVGMLLWIREKRWRALFILLVPTAYLLLIGAGQEAWARFRIPVEPLLAILAGAAIVGAHRRLAGRAGREA